jgi:23S rRNA-/tRNA-specific pseudouridylate synthase
MSTIQRSVLTQSTWPSAQEKPTEIQSRGFSYGVKHFRNPTSGPLLDVISNVLDLSVQFSAELISLGAVYVAEKRCTNPQQLVDSQTLLRVHTTPRRYNCEHNWRERVIHAQNDFLVLNKPGGIPSHPSVDNAIENSLTQTERALNKKLFISHRLDTTTEGLIVYGLTAAFVSSFNEKLQTHQLTKKYVALVETHGPLPQRLTHYMLKSPRAPKQVLANYVPSSDLCELEILQQRQVDGNTQWIEINLITGRTHQIRAQCAEIGAPIRGDKLYGALSPWKGEAHAPQIALRAYALEFEYDGKIHSFELDSEFNEPEPTTII